MRPRKKKLTLNQRYRAKKLSIKIPTSSKWIFQKFKLNSCPVKIEENCMFSEGKYLFSMGAFSYTHSQLNLNVSVGRYCSIGKGVNFLGQHHPLNRFTTSSITYDHGIFKNQNIIQKVPVESRLNTIIKNDVWIADNALIKNGVVINNGAVIGANAVVTKDVPPYAIVAGNPARIIKYRFNEKIISKLENIAWWNYNAKDFHSIPVDADIEVFIEMLTYLINEKLINRMSPRSIII